MPDLDVAAKADGEEAALADVDGVSWRAAEVGVHGLQLAHVPYLHLAVRSGRHHVHALCIGHQRTHWPLRSASMSQAPQYTQWLEQESCSFHPM